MKNEPVVVNPLISHLRQLQTLLETKMELTDFESIQTGQTRKLTKVSITVTNTAPGGHEWPMLVFMGVGISVAILGNGDKIKINQNQLKIHTVEPEKLRTPFKHGYARLDITGDFPKKTSDEDSHGKILFPGQSVVFEIDVPPEAVPYLEFLVQSTISRRHLFHNDVILRVPDALTRPLAVAAFRTLETLRISSGLDSVLTSMPDFGGDTRLAELSNFSLAISGGLSTNHEIQTVLNRTIKQHKWSWFEAYIRHAAKTLSVWTASFERMQEALSTNNLERIKTEAASIRALKEEAAQLSQMVKEMMSNQNITANELKE